MWERFKDETLGFCVSIRHANFMASQFNDVGIHSASITSETKNKSVRNFYQNSAKVKLKRYLQLIYLMRVLISPKSI